MEEKLQLNRPLRNSETGVWRRCQLKWYLTFVLGFLSKSVNPNFWLGGLVHHCLSEWYLERTTDPAHMFWTLGRQLIDQERSATVVIGGHDLGLDQEEQLEIYLELGTAMIEGWQDWDAENRDFDVLDSELSYYLEMETWDGEPFTFVARFDLLVENSEGIRVADLKTAKDFRFGKNIEMDQQFRRYPWAVREAHPEWADDVRGSMWLALKKMSPSTNPRSKPPYFASELIDLTPEEFTEIGNELVTEATQILRTEREIRNGVNPRTLIAPSPTFDCTWDCDYYKNGLCTVWRSGVDPIVHGLNYGSWDNDAYAEYKEDHETSVSTWAFAKREGGE